MMRTQSPRRPPRVLWLWTLAVGLLTSPARADFVPWAYTWSSSPSQVDADVVGTGAILLSDQPFLQNVVGDSFIVATNIRTESTASPISPATFTNKDYALTLTIVDQENSFSGMLTFTGQFNGTLSSSSANISNQFTGDTTQQLVLGNHRYTVTIGPFSPPGPPSSTPGGSGPAGTISAYAMVRVETLPEPGTLALAGMAIPVLALCRRRARRDGHGHA